MNSWQYRYDTGWINRSDWTNVHLGSNTTLNTDSNVTHNLNAPLSNLLVKLFLSTDGTDANSFEVATNIGALSDGGSVHGVTVYQVDANNIKLQTATNGLIIVQDSGAYLTVDTENWYYKIKAWYIG